MGRGPGGGGTGANGQDRERMGRDDREEEQGAGGERGRRREEEADRRWIDRAFPHLYTICTLHPPPIESDVPTDRPDPRAQCQGKEN